MEFRYVICDVFTDRPLAGNQLAVFTDARLVPENLLQLIAREMNFSETVFVYPGMGSWLAGAIFSRDYPVLQGGVLFLAVVFVMVNLIVDLSYAVINPRIRYS